MLEKVALQLTQIMIRQNIIDPADEEVYVYGWSITISTLGSLIVLLLIGAFLGKLVGTALFLAFFILLRIYAGGYHANSYGRCFFITMLFYAPGPILHFYLPSTYIDLTIAMSMVTAIGITWRWAPVDHPNKPLNIKDKQKNKKISRTIVLGQAAIVTLIGAWQPWAKQYLLWAAIGMAVTSFTLLYVIYNPYKKGGGANEIT